MYCWLFCSWLCHFAIKRLAIIVHHLNVDLPSGFLGTHRRQWTGDVCSWELGRARPCSFCVCLPELIFCMLPSQFLCLWSPAPCYEEAHTIQKGRMEELWSPFPAELRLSVNLMQAWRWLQENSCSWLNEAQDYQGSEMSHHCLIHKIQKIKLLFFLPLSFKTFFWLHSKRQLEHHALIFSRTFSTRSVLVLHYF